MHWRVFTMFILLFCLHEKVTFGQFCLPDVYAREFEGDLAAYYNNSIRHNSELIVVGHTLQHRDLWSDPMITKYSSRGQVLWAKRYNIAGYNNGYFYAVAPTPDSGLLVSGFFSMLRKRQNDGVVELLYSAAMLWKLDKYGNMVNGKIMTAFASYFVSINSLLALREGGYLAAGTVNGRGYARNLLFKLDDALNVVWANEFYDEHRTFASIKMFQRKNGEVLIAGSSMEDTEDHSMIAKTGYYLFNVRPEGGSLAWSRAYHFNSAPVSRPSSLQNVPFIVEHDNGNISLFSSYSDSTVFVLLPNVRSALHLEVNEFGVIRQATGITHEQPGCRLIDAQYEPEQNRFILFTEDGEYSRLSAYRSGGNSDWSRTMSRINGNLMGSALYRDRSGYLLFFSGRTQVANSGIIKTEAEGVAPCMETPSQLLTRDVTPEFRQENIAPRYTPAQRNLFEDLLTGPNKPDYPWKANTVCETNCCVNIPSDTSRIQLCNQPSYQLPDFKQVSQSGLYYTNHTTAFGCDSIAFYDITFSTVPQVNLGADTCFNKTDSLVISGPEGYDTYTWNNSSSQASSIKITEPGTYTLELENHCGTGKDSIVIYKDCAFEILMPNAFTPNGDGINEQFRIPKNNQNRLIRFSIFNRFGQLVFETSDIKKGWDGNWNNSPQPSGTFVYRLEMLSLDGRSFTQKGTIALIR
ncbi:gliding motility-associated C-terminal domain-containing protein [Flavihumibacter solisilvae]|uniref:gliding motility-associated C-terminal domain-containing protein n=1 Tax=Flavihumibacter solisilvae TaxID=1349421 RepID=UPI0009E54192|nr:gliding motility-associated C-terminal domain-containing protein [Flavihumibacter solisilvae]